MQIGSVKAISKGRERFMRSRVVSDFFCSYRHHQRDSPNSLRRARVFLMSIAGAYVSLQNRSKMKETPERIMTSQFVQRHPRYCEVKPPIMGPNWSCQKEHSKGVAEIHTTGPFKGPIDQTENTMERYSSVVTSPSEPGALAIKAAPAKAPKNRTMITSAREVARAQGSTRIIEMNMLIIYTVFRPYISDNGATIRVPQAIPRR